MSDPAALFTREEWQAMTDAEREQWRELRRMAVEHAQREHTTRQALNDSLTVERFSKGDTDAR
jgi:hypothetical protein